MSPQGAPSAPIPTPPTFQAPARAGAAQRVFAGVMAALCLAVLVVAAALSPDPAGMGTHRQLGLPPCGWVVSMGIPCPTCGMTTAFSNAAHARPLASLKAQPAGTLGALACAVVFWGCLHIAVFGSSLGRLMDRLLAPKIVWIAGAVVLLGWGYKIMDVKGLLPWNTPPAATPTATRPAPGPYPLGP